MSFLTPPIAQEKLVNIKINENSITRLKSDSSSDSSSSESVDENNLGELLP